jgi:hypothetical protein
MEESQHQIAMLAQRIAQLEAELKEVHASVASLKASQVTAPFTVVGTQGQVLLEVSALTIQDSQGQHEYPCIRLYNPERKLAAMLCASPEGVGFTLTDAQGYETLSISFGESGGAIRLRDGGVTLCRTVALGQQQEIVRMGVNGTARIEIYNHENVPVTVLGVNAHGGTLSVSNHNQHPAAVLAADAEGGNLLITGNAGQLRTWLSADDEGGRLELFNAAGEVVYAKP